MNVVVVVEFRYHFADLEAVRIQLVFYEIELSQKILRDLYNDLFM